MEAWKKAGQEIDSITSISAEELAEKIEKENVLVIDVRRPSEYTAEHVDGAKNLPLDSINDLMAEFPKNQTVYIHCAGGYRSMIAASILKSRGYDNLVDVAGGFTAIAQTGKVNLTDYACPTALKKH